MAQVCGVEDTLKELLRQLGTKLDVAQPRPYYPFWRLLGDGIWEIPSRFGAAVR